MKKIIIFLLAVVGSSLSLKAQEGRWVAYNGVEAEFADGKPRWAPTANVTTTSSFGAGISANNLGVVTFSANVNGSSSITRKQIYAIVLSKGAFVNFFKGDGKGKQWCPELGKYLDAQKGQVVDKATGNKKYVLIGYGSQYYYIDRFNLGVAPPK